MALVDAVHASTSDGLSRDESEAVEISKRLLHCTKAVPILDQRVHAPPSQRCAGAQQYGEHRTSRAGHQPTKGFAEVHLNRILFK